MSGSERPSGLTQVSVIARSDMLLGDYGYSSQSAPGFTGRGPVSALFAAMTSADVTGALGYDPSGASGTFNNAVHINAGGTLGLNKTLTNNGTIIGGTMIAGESTYTLTGTGSVLPEVWGVKGVSITGTTDTGSQIIHYAIVGDTAAVSHGGGSGGLKQEWRQYNFGGTGQTGPRSMWTHQLNKTAAGSDVSTSGPTYVIGNAWITINYSGGGTAYGGSNSAGNIYGFNPQVVLHNTAQYYAVANAWGEGDYQINGAAAPVGVTGAGGSAGTDVQTLTISWGSFTDRFGNSVSSGSVALAYTVPAAATATHIAGAFGALIRTNQTLRAANISATIDSGNTVATSFLTVCWPPWVPSVTVTNTKTGTDGTDAIVLGTPTGPGGSVDSLYGITVIAESGHTVPGYTYSAGYNVSTQPGVSPEAGWDGAYTVGHPAGIWPIQATGAILDVRRSQYIGGSGAIAPLTPSRCAYGARWTDVIFTTAAFSSPGVSITTVPVATGATVNISGTTEPSGYIQAGTTDGAGAIIVGNSMIAATPTGLQITSPGWIGSGDATVVAAGPGGATTNYYPINDIVHDPYGGQHQVVTVNGTGGVTGIHTIVQPSFIPNTPAAGGLSSPPGTITTLGGSSSGLTIAPTWEQPNTVALGSSSGTVTVSGTLTPNATLLAAITAIVHALPTSSPGGSGTLWLNGGVVQIS